MFKYIYYPWIIENATHPNVTILQQFYINEIKSRMFLKRALFEFKSHI